MASFRYRVWGHGKVLAGCPDLKTARVVAQIISQRTGGAVFVYDHPHGSGETGEHPQVAWFLNGEES
jgi:hypothetical protein